MANDIGGAEGDRSNDRLYGLVTAVAPDPCSIGVGDGADDMPEVGAAEQTVRLAMGTGQTAPLGSRAGREPPLEAGDEIGRYRLIQRLGAGGMGVVWLAHDPLLDRTVALKVLHQRKDSAHERREQERLRREGVALAGLSHPNVVSIYDVGIHRGRVFLAMEPVYGLSMREWSKQAPDLDAILDAFEQAAAGLAAVHDAGFVHRDLKPSNLMRTSDGRVLVMDFGLARVHGMEGPSARVSNRRTSSELAGFDTPFSAGLTADDVVVGTPPYMAPEQHLGAEASVRSDQYSLCVSLYELLMGRRPFTGQTMGDLALSKRSGPSLGVDDGRIRVPKRLRALILRGLAPDPEDRHPDIHTVRDELARLRASRRSRLKMVVAAVAVAVAVAVVVVVVTVGGRPSIDLGDACDAADARFRDIWSADTRQSVRRSFAATGLEYSSDAAERVIDELNEYTEAWRASHRQACDAAEQHPDGFDQRMMCLSESRAFVSATVKLMLEADASVVEHALEQVEELPSVSRCDALSPTSPLASPPVDAPSRRTMEALLTKLASARALNKAARYPEALELANEALAEARRLGHEPSIATAGFIKGVVYFNLLDDESAIEVLTESALLAVSLDEHRVAADASVLLVRVAAQRTGTLEEARRWARQAEVSLEHLPAGTAVSAQLDRIRAVIAGAEGRAEDALALRLRVYAIEREQRGDDDSRVIEAQVQVASDYDDLGRHAEAERVWRSVLSKVEDTLGAAHPDYGNNLMNLGLTVGRQGLHDEAEQLFARALENFRGSLEPDHPLIGEALNLLGSATASQDRLLEAEEYFRRATEHAERVLGIHHPLYANALSEYSAVRGELGKSDEALRDFARVRVLIEEVDGPDHPRLAYPLMVETDLMIRLGRLSEAEQRLERLGTLIAQSPELVPRVRADAQLHWGRLEHARENWDEAREHSRLAHELLCEALGCTHPDSVVALRVRGEIERDSGHFERAEPLLREALALAASRSVGEAFRSSIRFALAQTVWPDPSKRAEAVRLTDEARRGFAGFGRTFTDKLAEIDQWEQRR